MYERICSIIYTVEKPCNTNVTAAVTYHFTCLHESLGRLFLWYQYFIEELNESKQSYQKTSQTDTSHMEAEVSLKGLLIRLFSEKIPAGNRARN